MDNGRPDPFENKGNPVSDATIKEKVNHPGGKWHPAHDSTVKTAPPDNLKSE